MESACRHVLTCTGDLIDGWLLICMQIIHVFHQFDTALSEQWSSLYEYFHVL